MYSSYRNALSSFLKQLGWWMLFIVCLFYALYALYFGTVEILHQLGMVTDAKFRAQPWIFVIHALAGAAALAAGPLQFNRRLLSRNRTLHRLSGRVYVYAIWASSIAALWNAVFFDVEFLAKIAFGVLAILWFSTTTIAFLRIRMGNIREHREWMIRSFSLSLFFITGGFWMPGLTSTSLPPEIAYPLAVFVSWALNFAVAEIWIRRTRNKFASRELTNLVREGSIQAATSQGDD